MAIIAGASFSGRYSELTVVSYATRNPSDKTGSGASGYASNKASEANIEKGTTYIGSSVSVFSPELAALFGSDDV
jgi:hypothetical protein